MTADPTLPEIAAPMREHVAAIIREHPTPEIRELAQYFDAAPGTAEAGIADLVTARWIEETLNGAPGGRDATLVIEPGLTQRINAHARELKGRGVTWGDLAAPLGVQTATAALRKAAPSPSVQTKLSGRTARPELPGRAVAEVAEERGLTAPGLRYQMSVDKVRWAWVNVETGEIVPPDGTERSRSTGHERRIFES